LPNRLANEKSPYLLQHADNPVDWYPWGEEAFERARSENKPILLSIGYSACHWCHVMAHESFENSETARLMNENFINIKVDREERPDIDTVYMDAVQAMTGSGGWPLTVFLTPDRKPFFGGTYFPPQDKHGIPGFPQVLVTIAQAYKQQWNDIEQTVKQLTAALASKSKTSPAAGPLTVDIFSQAFSILKQLFDRENGGFGTAPKFPQPMVLEFLLRYSHRSRDTEALSMISSTLEQMSQGGIYDQLGGGFHRYSTDNHWLVPHFEKMLYDNALLSQLYLHAYVATGKQLFRSTVEETLDYVLREMTGEKGGFYSTQDADSEGIEGKYYVWTSAEIVDVMGQEESKAISEYFGVTEQGNFEGRNILYVVQKPQAVTKDIIKQAKTALLSRREQRIKPGRDEKVLASWNGLMLASLAESACVLGRKDYLAAARANGSFLLESMIEDEYLKHSYKDGKAKVNGLLEDYAMVIEGLLCLHQATFEGKWLRQAVKLSEIMVKEFWDEGKQALYDTSLSQQDLFVRPRNIFDNALPSGSSVATLVLLKLAKLTNNERLEQIAAQSLRSVSDSMASYPLGFGNWLCALDFYLSSTKEIAIIGPRDNKITSKLVHTLYNIWLPNKVVAAFDPDDPNHLPELELLKNRQMINGQPTVYVCEKYTCLAPVTEPEALITQLQKS